MLIRLRTTTAVRKRRIAFLRPVETMEKNKMRINDEQRMELYMIAMGAFDGNPDNLYTSSPLEIAIKLGVHNSHVYRALKWDFTKTFVKAAEKLTGKELYERRIRIAFDTDAETRQAIRAAQKRAGLSDAEVCEMLLAIMED